MDRHTAEDLAQEVALRAVRDAVTFTDVDDLARWSIVVATRLAMNHHRDGARVRLGAVPEVVDRRLPEEVVVGRLAVSAVATALASLDEEERTLLTGDVPAPDTRRARVHLAVRKHRVRAQLRALVAGAAAWLGGVPLLRRVLRTAPLTAFASTLVALVALVALDSGPRQEGSTDQLATRPASTPLAPTPTSVELDASQAGASAERSPERPEPDSSVVPLDPLHGAGIEWPDAVSDTADGGVRVRPSDEHDRVFCAENYPVLGSFCTPF